MYILINVADHQNSYLMNKHLYGIGLTVYFFLGTLELEVDQYAGITDF